jgi:hypothetical protein
MKEKTMQYKIVAAWALGKMNRDNFIEMHNTDELCYGLTKGGDSTLLYDCAEKFSILGLIFYGTLDVFGFQHRAYGTLYQKMLRVSRSQYAKLVSELTYTEAREVLMAVVEK